MLINIINQDAEYALLQIVELHDPRHALMSAFHFFSSQLPDRPLEEEILLAVRSLLEDKQATLYFFRDGDIVITWNGPQKAVYENLCTLLYKNFCPPGSEGLHRYYDLGAHGEDLRLLCRHKREAMTAGHSSPARASAPPLSQPKKHGANLTPPTEGELKTFAEAHNSRSYRGKPMVLVVEDQLFSRSLMMGILQRNYRIEAVDTAEEALKIYLESAPDIAFLDIELPGSSGHDLATLINTFDANAFIVMVTANNYVEDINRARKNNVRGFIVKPYSRQKVLDSIEKFNQEHKKRRAP